MKDSESTNVDKANLVHEDVSVEVVLERRQRSYSCGEPRIRAMAVARVPDHAIEPAAIRKRIVAVADLVDERLTIRKLLEKFETLPISEVAAQHGKITTDPYTSIADGQAATVNGNAIDKWLRSELVKKLSGKYTTPLQFVDVNITLIDERTAAATYTILQGGVAGATSTILVKGNDGQWRITVHCQHPITG
jgi:hypothetical protein